jgi:hypothetical protein
MPKELTEQQKLLAMAARFYQGIEWEPKAGDYYTTSRADLELYQVTDVREGKVYTNYCGTPTPEDSEWDQDGFTTEGFGPMRVWVPDWVLSS